MSVVSVSASDVSSFSKQQCSAIDLPEGQGKVFLIDDSVYQELRRPGGTGGHTFFFGHGDLGENITTSELNVELTELQLGTMLHFGPLPRPAPENMNGNANGGNPWGARIFITEYVYAGRSFENFSAGLTEVFNDVDVEGRLIKPRPVGVIGLVEEGGVIMPGQSFRVETPDAEATRRVELINLENGISNLENGISNLENGISTFTTNGFH